MLCSLRHNNATLPLDTSGPLPLQPRTLQSNARNVACTHSKRTLWTLSSSSFSILAGAGQPPQALTQHSIPPTSLSILDDCGAVPVAMPVTRSGLRPKDAWPRNVQVPVEAALAKRRLSQSSRRERKGFRCCLREGSPPSLFLRLLGQVLCRLPLLFRLLQAKCTGPDFSSNEVSVAVSKPLGAWEVLLEAPAEKTPGTVASAHSPAKPFPSDPPGAEATPARAPQPAGKGSTVPSSAVSKEAAKPSSFKPKPKAKKNKDTSSRSSHGSQWRR